MHETRVRVCFFLAIVSVITIVFTDSFVIYYMSKPSPCFIQVALRALGYVVRPLVALFLFLVVIRREKKINFLLYVPEIINIIVNFITLFCKISFYFNESNQYCRGPLSFVSHIVGFFYGLCCIWGTFRFFKEKNYSEGFLLVFLFFALVIGVVLDVLISTRLTVATSSLCVIFYYLYFQTQSQKRDLLTNAYNRKTLYMDSLKYKREITALIGLDLNDLKLLNDTKGHAEGDKGLITLAEIVMANLPTTCRLYRTGGDEFVVLCRKETKDNVEKIITVIKENMQLTPYRCAIGMAYVDNNSKFDIDMMYKLADEMMYKDKVKMKSGRNYRESQRNN